MSHDPQRLSDAASTPPDLGEALESLRDGSRDAARIERVASRLDAMLDAPPPTASGAGLKGAVHVLRKLRWLLAGAVGVGVLWLSGNALFSPAPTTDSHAPMSAALPAPVPDVVEAPAEAPPAEPASPVELPASSDTRAAAPKRAPFSARTGRQRHANPASVASNTGNVPKARAGAADVTAPSEAVVASAPAPASTAPLPEAPQQDAGIKAPPKSEIELLFEARAMRGSAPREALRLLDEHAQRFREGQLAPEREVMAIEILRSLGQTQEADARVGRFRARYPKSLHLRRLEQTGK